MDTEPFSLNRRVAWGECDPAGIYYTPRAAYYAVEALEAWYGTVLGTTWAGLSRNDGLRPSFRRIECSYLRPLAASQNVCLRLWVTRADESDLDLRVTGNDEAGKTCFRADLATVLLDGDLSPRPIPANLRRRVERYRDGCGCPEPQGRRKEAAESESEGLPVPSSQGGRQVRGNVFTRPVHVHYGDCDASGFLHPPRTFDYAVEAVGEWFEAVPGISWMDLVWRRRQGAPFVTADCEYLRPLSPGQQLTLSVRVTHLGGASLGFAVSGFDSGDREYFRSRLEACFIDHENFRAIPIPEEYRQSIEEYRIRGSFP